MNTPTRPFLAVLALGLAAAPAAAQEDPKPEPEVVPAIPLVIPQQAAPKAGTGAVMATPMMQPAAAQAQGATTSDADGYAALDQEYADAYRAWMRKIQELRGTGEEYPPDPSAGYYPRFRALADRGNVDARVWCLQNFEHDATSAEYRAWAWKGEAFSLATASRNNPELARRTMRALFGGAVVDGVGEEWVGNVLDYMYDTAADESVAASILASRASRAEYARDPEVRATAKALYAELLERHPDSKEAQRAKGKLFAAENLQVGKVAPDFTANDVDGNPITLSDYRGKVVLVDFWGFW